MEGEGGIGELTGISKKAVASAHGVLGGVSLGGCERTDCWEQRGIYSAGVVEEGPDHDLKLVFLSG